LHEAFPLTNLGGSTDLPLHGRRVPRWLADRMTRLGALMTEAIEGAGWQRARSSTAWSNRLIDRTPKPSFR
jgi:hypothetical protein